MVVSLLTLALSTAVLLRWTRERPMPEPLMRAPSTLAPPKSMLAPQRSTLALQKSTLALRRLMRALPRSMLGQSLTPHLKKMRENLNLRPNLRLNPRPSRGLNPRPNLRWSQTRNRWWSNPMGSPRLFPKWTPKTAFQGASMTEPSFCAVPAVNGCLSLVAKMKSATWILASRV